MKKFALISLLISSLAISSFARANQIEVGIIAHGIAPTCFQDVPSATRDALKDLQEKASKQCAQEGGTLGDLDQTTLSINQDAKLKIQCGGVITEGLFFCIKDL
jgi:Skp family chaperone for outer membrane proteins